MNHLPKNLQYLRELHGIKPSEIPDKVGIKRSTWNGYEKGTSEPNIDTLLVICRYFEVSIGELIETELKDTVRLIHDGQEKINTKNVRPSVRPSVRPTPKNPDIASTEGTPGNVYIFETQAAAGVPQLLHNEDKLIRQPTLYLPELGTGIHIRMQIHGDSMHSTIKDGDNVIATWQPEPLQTLREGHIYLIIDREEGAVCKRVYKAGKDALDLESDNDIYKPYKRHLSDILAMFRVVEVHTSDLRNYYSDTRKEIKKIWKAIEDLKSKK